MGKIANLYNKLRPGNIGMRGDKLRGSQRTGIKGAIVRTTPFFTKNVYLPLTTWAATRLVWAEDVDKIKMVGFVLAACWLAVRAADYLVVKPSYRKMKIAELMTQAKSAETRARKRGERAEGLERQLSSANEDDVQQLRHMLRLMLVLRTTDELNSANLALSERDKAILEIAKLIPRDQLKAELSALLVNNDHFDEISLTEGI